MPNCVAECRSLQVDERDWDSVTVSLYLEESNTGTPAISTNEVHGLTCVTETDDSTSALITLGFMGGSVTLKANSTLSELRYGKMASTAPYMRHMVQTVW